MILFILLFYIILNLLYSSPTYPWLNNPVTKPTEMISDIKTPSGYIRTIVPEESFGEWIRKLPLKNNHPYVYLYTGEKKKNQKAQYKVIDIDVGKSDLQQCADAIIRLRAEYLYSMKDFNNLHFNFTNNDTAYYHKWAEGFRPFFSKNKSSWQKTKSKDSSYSSFREYLNIIFTYSGSYSLNKELVPIKNIRDINIGDIFIQGGFPGHAVIVVDVASNKLNQNKIFLLAQSYMPAQEIHILKNPNDNKLNPWYDLEIDDILYTPEWDFIKTDLKRWKE